MPNELIECTPTQNQIFSQNSHLGSENKIFVKRLRAETLKSRSWSRISGLIHSKTAPPLGNNWYSYVAGDPINNSDPSGYNLVWGFFKAAWDWYKKGSKPTTPKPNPTKNKKPKKPCDDDKGDFVRCMAAAEMGFQLEIELCKKIPSVPGAFERCRAKAALTQKTEESKCLNQTGRIR